MDGLAECRADRTQKYTLRKEMCRTIVEAVDNRFMYTSANIGHFEVLYENSIRKTDNGVYADHDPYAVE